MLPGYSGVPIKGKINGTTCNLIFGSGVLPLNRELFGLCAGHTKPPYQAEHVYGHRSWRDQLMAHAARIAINRTVADVHFPVDSAAGAVLGLALGKYFVSRCKEGEKYQTWTFDGGDYPPERDFHSGDLLDSAGLMDGATGRQEVHRCCSEICSVSDSGSPKLAASGQLISCRVPNRRTSYSPPISCPPALAPSLASFFRCRARA